MERSSRYIPSRRLLRNLWELVTPYRSSVKKALVWIAIGELLGLAEPLIFMVFIDRVVKQVQTGQTNITELAMLMAGAMLALAVIQLAAKARNGWTNRIVYQIDYDIQADCTGKLLRMPLVYFQQDNPGKIVGKMGRGVGRTVDVIQNLAFQMLPVLASFLVVMLVMPFIRWRSLAVAVPAIALYAWLEWRKKQKLAASRHERENLYEDANAAVSQALANIQTVQAFGQEDREHAKASGLWGRARDLSLKELWVIESAGFVQQSVFILAQAIILLDCGWGVLMHALTIGQLYLVFNLMNRMFGSARQMSFLFQRLAAAEEPISRTLEILRAEPVLEHVKMHAAGASDRRGSVEFKSVDYSYPKTGDSLAETDRHDKSSLEQISFSIKPKQTVAIVGLSGSGKTTLLKLLMRYDDPTQGNVLVDGTDIRRTELKEHRGRLGFVGKPQLFNATVAENIAYGKPDATDDEMLEAAKMAQAHDFIQNLPKRLRENIGNDGETLSDGQKQRLVLARALVTKPSILLMDEPWSHLDALNAWEIKRAIMEQNGQRTILIVTHDILGLERHVDQILVMDQGRLVEQGTHDSLLRKGGVYALMHGKALAQLHSLQMTLGNYYSN